MEDQCKQVDKYIVTSKLLGKGSFGTVYRGFFKEDQSKVIAVKVIPIENIGNKGNYESAENNKPAKKKMKAIH